MPDLLKRVGRLLPELLLVVVGWCGERSRDVHSLGALGYGPGQQLLLSPEGDVEGLGNQAFGHCAEEKPWT